MKAIKWDGMVQSGMWSQFLWEEMDFENRWMNLKSFLSKLKWHLNDISLFISFKADFTSLNNNMCYLYIKQYLSDISSY
jgi:hypothetical protein